MTLEPGDRLGVYEVIEPLGEGGMGVVFRALDTRLQREVALKVLSPSVALDPERLARFRREAQTLAALNHPNVGAIYGLEESEQGLALVLELVPGETLAARLARETLPLADVLSITRQISEALEAAHARGIVHRDLKPANVMLRSDGVAKVLDFGLAKAAATDSEQMPVAEDATRTALTLVGRIQGTPPYMSPEQLRGGVLDQRTDLWALGCVVYEMLTGGRAFPADGVAEAIAMVLERDPDWGRVPRDTPPALVDLMRRCLVKPLGDRPRQMADVRHAVAQASRPRVSGSHDLPLPRTALVGRETELAEVVDRLTDPAVRLLTLTGPGGSGKTRLAVEAGRGCVDAFPGGVRFVALAGVGAADSVAPTVAQAFGITVAPGQPVLDALRDEMPVVVEAPTLLVLDNLEHLTGAAPVVGALIDSCQQLTVLATSRALLQIYAEHEYPVPPLALPATEADWSVEELSRNPAVALFVERAVAASPRFALTPDNASDVLGICARLDGLPLAIELAAARVRLFQPAVLRTRLTKSLALLTGGPRDAPGRLQTLRATLDWSHELLEPAEQRLFRRLAVFAGGFTLDAAEAVANAWQDLDDQVLDGLTSLVSKSVLQHVESVGPDVRFLMLETVREYAAERLEAARESRTARKAHAAYFLLQAEEVTRATADDVEQWLDSCAADYDNLRAALDWLIASGSAEWAVRMGLALRWFWDARERFEERSRYFDALEVVSRSLGRTVARAEVLRTSAIGKADVRERQEEALQIFRGMGDRRGEAGTLNDLAVSARIRSDWSLARRLQEQCLALCRELGDPSYTAGALSNLADIMAGAGDLDAAESTAVEALQMFGDLEDAAVGWTLSRLGDIWRARRDWRRAENHYGEALSVFEREGEAWGVGRTCIDLGHLAIDEGEHAAATGWFARALEGLANLGHRAGVGLLFDGVARLMARQHRDEDAAVLAGAATTAHERAGFRTPYRQGMSFLENEDWTLTLDAEAERRARARGRAMTVSEAIELARSALG